MEKLFDLLKQHCRKRYGFKDNDNIEIDADSVSFHLYLKGERLFPIRVETVICKEFGFIKWLVENDKIDTDAYKTVYSGDLDKRKTLVESRDGEEIYQVTEHGVYESLLMLLSISSSPIEDLISYLR